MTRFSGSTPKTPGSPATPGARVAYFANFTPNKLGTGENRLVALACSARKAGHSFTLFCHPPIHSEVARMLSDEGAGMETLTSLGSNPWVTGRRLSRTFDVIQLNLIAPRSRIALAAYAAWPAAVLFLDHVSGPPTGDDPGQSLLSRMVDRLTMARVKQVAGVSDFVTERAKRRFGLPENRTCTMYGGVDHHRFRPPAVARPASGTLRIAVVSALIPEKGVGILLEALAKLSMKDWTLSVVGAGPQEEELRARTEGLGLSPRVNFLGLRDDVDQILRDSDILVHPAIWQEALGYTVLEGMASGCAVVASRTGGIPELIQHGANGWLTDAGSSEQMADGLETLGADPGLRARLGAAARARVEGHFTVERSVESLIKWWEWAASSQG